MQGYIPLVYGIFKDKDWLNFSQGLAGRTNLSGSFNISEINAWFEWRIILKKIILYRNPRLGIEIVCSGLP